MRIYLRDRNQAMVDAWKIWFDDCPDVHVSCGNIFDEGEWMKAEAIISPANSFGFMDGGIDYVYSQKLGWGMSEELRTLIHENHRGELLVGQAQVVDIRNTNPDTPIPYLISAPTMRVPMDVSRTVNAFLAFRAALWAADSLVVSSVLCPGLATAIGKMSYDVCAIQMFEAYTTYKNPRVFDVLGLAHARHYMMLNPEAYWMTHMPGQTE